MSLETVNTILDKQLDKWIKWEHQAFDSKHEAQSASDIINAGVQAERCAGAIRALEFLKYEINKQLDI